MNVLTRVTYPISYDIFDIQEIKNRDKHECSHCGENPADFRLVKNQVNPFTVYWCMNCIDQELENFMEEQLDKLKERLTRYQVKKEL